MATPDDSPDVAAVEKPEKTEDAATASTDASTPDGAAVPVKVDENGMEYFDDGADGAAGGGGEKDEIRAAPQAQKETEPPSSLQAAEGEEGMEGISLSPLDLQNQRQNMKDVLMNPTAMAPPLADADNGEGGGGHHVKFAEEEPEHHQSALHQDEYAQYSEGLHNPHNHESALGLGSTSAGGQPSGTPPRDGATNPFKARKKNRLVPSADGKRGCSHPRKSPYRSEVGRMRHAAQVEREKRGEKDGDEGSSAAGSGKSISIAETTAPPDSAFLSVQATKFKHSLLHSLGEFLTSAFADDEETSGSYFSQDLLDQLSVSNPYLKGVWLQAKNLNDKHVQQLCEALIRNKVVTEVWLPSNQITDVGAGHIAHMLKFNKSIKELFLGENQIGPKGAASIASALARGNTTLVALGLGDNRIGVEGAGAFAAALRHNHSLHTLDIKNNGIPKKSSIRGLLNKMLEFNASDPGDESLVLGLQEELANLVSTLPADKAENVVLQAEEALKMAMLCRKRGDKVGAAEAEGIFIRICTTGEPPIDPPEEMQSAINESRKQRVPVRTKKSRTKKPLEPDRLDDLNAELSTLKFDDGPVAKKVGGESGVDADEEGGEPKEPDNGADDEVKESEEGKGSDEEEKETAEKEEAADEEKPGSADAVDEACADAVETSAASDAGAEADADADEGDEQQQNDGK